MTERRLLGLGAAACALALLGAIVGGEGAWRAWLAAASFAGAAPVGAVALVLMMRLLPGGWRQAEPSLAALGLLTPLAGLLLAPILFFRGEIYPTAGEGFRAVYLSSPLVALRALAWFGGLSALAFAAARRPPSAALACIGLTLYPLFGTLVATDWLLSLDPTFASSGFGLYVLSIQATTAFAAALMLAPPRSPGAPAAVLLSLVLLWAYLAFMHYFISWSDNLPPAVRWYRQRSVGGWAAVMALVAATRLTPALLLLFAPVRRSRSAVRWLAATVVAGSLLEAGWLAMPGADGVRVVSGAFVLLLADAAAMGLLVLGLLPFAQRRVFGWRTR